jgi:hypothetical protein
VNGRLFVEVEVALPRELEFEQRVELAREMAEWLSYKMPSRETDAVSDGPLPYTLVLHKGHDEQNPHAHIMLNERPTDGVVRELEVAFKRANREHPELGGAAKSMAFKHPDTMNEVRQEWELKANAALERAGREERINHRSYKERGLSRSQVFTSGTGRRRWSGRGLRRIVATSSARSRSATESAIESVRLRLNVPSNWSARRSLSGNMPSTSDEKGNKSRREQVSVRISRGR